MARIYPFRALRYNAEKVKLQDVVTQPYDKLTPADPHDIAGSIAFALLFSGKKRVQDSDRLMASIVAERIVTHLNRCGFVISKKPPIGGSAPLNPPPMQRV